MAELLSIVKNMTKVKPVNIDDCVSASFERCEVHNPFQPDSSKIWNRITGLYTKSDIVRLKSNQNMGYIRKLKIEN